MDPKTGFIVFRNDQFDWLMKISGVLSKREMAVLMAIIRFTFGFNRKESRLSGTYLSEACGIRANHIPATLKKLSDRGLIEIKSREDKNTNTIRFDWAKTMSTDTPKLGVSDTPKSGGEILPNREERYSQNGSKLTPKLGGKTIKKTIQKYKTEETEDIEDESSMFDELI